MTGARRRLAIVTSGGDAPGMNAVIAAAADRAQALGLELIGVHDGYAGLVEGKLSPLPTAAIEAAALDSGTWLGTARFPDFCHAEVRARALAVLAASDVGGLIVCGGNGSLAGAATLAAEAGVGRPLDVVAVPASIDGDVGTACVGFATAVTAAANEIAVLLATARSHRRIFVVEIFGARAGVLPRQTGIAVRADAIFVPERLLPAGIPVAPAVMAAVEAELDVAMPALAQRFHAGARAGILVVAEALRLATRAPVHELLRHALTTRVAAWSATIRPDVRTHVISYTLRGCRPVAADLILAQRLGAAAVDAVARHASGVLAMSAANTLTPEDIAPFPCPHTRDV